MDVALFPQLPKLVRFMLHHMVNGIVIGCVTVLVAIYTDFLGIGARLASDHSGIATFLLFYQASLTFGGVSMAIAIMHLGEDDD